MNFRQFAFKNVFRNKRLYAGYFISCAFSVMIFFVYSMLAFHPELNMAGSGKYGRGAQAGMEVAQYIIYVFSFFFILYSMSVFLKTRKKEFGVCIMQGMSDMQLKRLVFVENIIIGFASTVAGILTGLVMSKGMLMIGSSLLYLDDPLSFYFPTTALWFTFAAFMVLFIAISLFTATILRTSSLIDLLKASTKPKPEPKANVWLALFAALCIVGGYGVAFVVRGEQVLFAMLPVVVLVSIGTYFLFTQLSVFIIHRLKKKQKLYRRNTNMLTLSDLAYRMKDNARMFFLVAIISTVAFTAIGTLVGFKAMLTNSVADLMPPMSYESNTMSNKHEQKHVAMIESALKKENIKYDAYIIHNKTAEFKDGSIMKVIGATEYNSFAKARIQLRHGEGFMLETKSNDFGNTSSASNWSKEQSLTLKQTGKLKLVESLEMTDDVRQYVSGSEVLVMSDEDFKATPLTKFDETNYIFDMENWQATKALSADLEKQFQKEKQQDFRFQSRATSMSELNQGMGQILLTGLFVGIVFFVSAGSFLYFRLFSDLDNDLIQYRAISKLGLTEGELSKVVTTQIGLLFFVPIIVAIVHGAVALNTLQNLFPNVSILKEIVLVLGTFFIIQVVYFLFIRANYVRKLKKVL